MAMTKPRIHFLNRLFLNRNNLRATTELDADHGVENLADWFGGRYWKPTMVSNPPATEYVYCYNLNRSYQIPVQNWYMRDWTNGAAAAPDGATLAGAGASVARNSTAGQFAIDQYSAAVTRAGADATLLWEEDDWEQHVGGEVTLGAHVYATVADRARLVIDDGANQTYSAYHDGSSAEDWLDVTHEMSHDATQLKYGLQVDTGDTTATIDGIALYIGDTVAETPHATSVECLAAFDHNFYTAGQTVSLEYTDDAADWSSPTTHLTLAPTSDKATWVDGTAVSKGAWRIKFLGDTGSKPAAVAVMSFGSILELPQWLQPGTFGPYDRNMVSNSPSSAAGFGLGRSLRSEPIPMRITIPMVAESWVNANPFRIFWLHAGDGSYLTVQDDADWGGLPFFLQWDDGDHSTQTFFARIPARFRLRLPLDYSSGGNIVKKFNLDMLVVAE